MARILPKRLQEPLEAFIPDVITVFSRIVKQTFLGPEAKDCLLLALAARALVLHHWFKNASSSRTSSRWDRSNYYSNYQPTQVAMSLFLTGPAVMASRLGSFVLRRTLGMTSTR